MFMKKFNNLSDSLIESSRKVMTEKNKKANKNPSSRNDEIDRHQKIMDADAEREERKKMPEAKAPNWDPNSSDLEKKYKLRSPDGKTIERTARSLLHMNPKVQRGDLKPGAKLRHQYNAPQTHEIVEASNEEPNINHLELSEEELNELSPAALQAYREKSRERMRNPNVAGHELQKRQTGFSTAGKKISGDAKVRAKEPANKPTTKMNEGDDRRAIRKEIDKARATGKPIPSIATVRARLAKAATKKAVVQKPVVNQQPKAKPEDPEESARKHPIDRLRRIALSTGGGHFEYDNGEKHKISRDVARTVVKHYELPSEQGGLKPYQKEKLQSDITKSHEHMMNHYNKISGTNEDAYAPPAKGKSMLLEPEAKNKKKELDEVPCETQGEIRRDYQNEETDDETPPFEPDKKKKYTGSAKSRATWLAKHARDAMKKKMKTEQVKPGGDMAPNIHIPEGQIRFKKFPSPEAAKQGLSGVVSGQTPTTKIGEPSKPPKMNVPPSSRRKPLEDRLGEEPIDEREMTKAEMDKREKIVMRLKDKMAGFKKRYGSRAKDVMYATATKMAMKEEEKTPKEKTMTGQKADPVDINPSAPTKEGIGVKSTTT